MQRRAKRTRPAVERNNWRAKPHNDTDLNYDGVSRGDVSAFLGLIESEVAEGFWQDSYPQP